MKPLVLVHGMFESPYWWADWVTHFSSTRSVWVVDFYQERARNAGLQHYYQVLERALVMYGESPVLIGHSMGGPISLKVAERHSAAVAGVALINPAPPRHIPIVNWQLTSRLMKYAWRIARGQSFAPTSGDADYLMWNAGVSAERKADLLPGVGDVTPVTALQMLMGVRLRLPRHPVQVLLSRQDHFTPFSVGVRTAKWLGIQPEVFQEDGHLLPYGDNRFQAIATVERWLVNNGL